MRRRGAAGFTLVELVLALSILAVMITILFSGLRVGLRAWERGEAKASSLQHSRSMTQLLEDALSGIYPYTGLTEQGNVTPVIYFKGEPERMYFVTVSPPVPLSATVPFTAVTLAVDTGNVPGLSIREKALPNFDPFEAVAPLLVDPTIATVRFRYQRDGGAWEEAWDGVEERSVPRAIEVTLTKTTASEVPETLPAIVVPIRVNLP